MSYWYFRYCVEDSMGDVDGSIHNCGYIESKTKEFPMWEVLKAGAEEGCTIHVTFAVKISKKDFERIMHNE